ncbi:MAG: hypothetical protein NT103_06210 [Campylobacterales bacterium]|nr:hypothetical protein [Campylobacterales bacterium]
MSNIRLVEASLEIIYDLREVNADEFEKEFNGISEHDDDAIGQWLRSAKVKGETSESDPAVLHLIVELYRKMDRLENLILGNAPKRLPLGMRATIEKIGLEHFELAQPLFETSKLYYGRVELPVLPRRETPIYFEALSPTLAKITRMHVKDSNEWAIYMTARERSMIRHLKGLE